MANKTKLRIQDYRGTICEITLPFEIDENLIEVSQGADIIDTDEYEEGVTTLVVHNR